MSWWAPGGVAKIGPLKSGKWDEHGRPTDTRLRNATCACGCGAKFQTTDPRKKYVDARHRSRARSRSEAGKASDRRRWARLQARTDLVCRWCQAKSTEVTWSKNVNACAACARARLRVACPKCGAPVTHRVARGWCVSCDPKPEGFVEVILLDEGSDRERTVWRKPTGKRGWVSVAYVMRPIDSDPMVLTLPTNQWLRTRR